MAPLTTYRSIKGALSSIRTNADLLFLVILALLLYLSFMSRSLDEWDSYNFAFALTDYDIVRHRPHPPGYPLYVFFGQVMRYLVKDSLTALTVVSAISGALTVIPVYLITRRMYDRESAILVSLVMIFTPALWISSECALTDTLFTFLLTSSIFLLHLGTAGSKESLQLSWLLYGFSIGARPNPSSLAFLVLWVPITICVLVRIGDTKTGVRAVFAFLAGGLVWFLPMIAVTGWNSYWTAMMKQFIESSTTESAWSRTLGLDSMGRLIYIIVQLMTFSLGGAFVGVDAFFSATNPLFFLHGVFLIIAIVMCFINIKNIVDKRFLFLWVVPYFLFTYLFGTLNYPRYYLPIIPGLIIPLIVSSAAITRDAFSFLKKQRINRHIKTVLQLGFPMILIGSFFVNTIGFAIIIHSELAPTKQLFNYVTENYPQDTALIEFHEHRVFQYYPNKIRYLHALEDENRVLIMLSQFSSNATILLTTSSYNHLVSHRAVAELRVITVVEFFRDPHTVVEDHRILLYKVTSVRLR